ncbi:MAG TPA: hypothetical protein HA232_03835 [Methanocellales archaeon]|nr:hypothetical protein [Methanocellales archaeon]
MNELIENGGIASFNEEKSFFVTKVITIAGTKEAHSNLVDTKYIDFIGLEREQEGENGFRTEL